MIEILQILTDGGPTTRRSLLASLTSGRGYSSYDEVNEVIAGTPVTSITVVGNKNLEVPPLRDRFIRSSTHITAEGEQVLTCFGVANYILSQGSEEAGDLISNLKLQKLMYYCQGFYLALYDKPLFLEPIEAWMHGPVVPELYHAYKSYGAGALPLPVEVDFSIYDEQTRDLLNEVYNVYGQYSAWKLAKLTHDESPWRDAAENRDVISHEALKSYFKTQLISG